MVSSAWDVSVLCFSLSDKFEPVDEVGVLALEIDNWSDDGGCVESVVLVMLSWTGLLSSDISFTELKDSGNNLEQKNYSVQY